MVSIEAADVGWLHTHAFQRTRIGDRRSEGRNGVMSLCLQSMSGHRWGLRVVVQLVELGFHGGVAAGQFFDRDVLSLVVGEA